MGALLYWAGQAAALVLVGLLLAAVLWESAHLVDWALTLSGGDPASYLRHHAYDYVTWLFGTDFGWTVEG
jgi:hypothetical protein